MRVINHFYVTQSSQLSLLCVYSCVCLSLIKDVLKSIFHCAMTVS